MKKKVLIVTLNDYIIYQPTILNLYDFLLPHFDVQIISFKPEFVTQQKDETRNIIYLEPSPRWKELYNKFDFAMSKVAKLVRKIKPGYIYHYRYYNKYLPQVLRNYLRRTKPQVDVVIAVDFPALHVAQQHFGSVHFLSLEIDNKDTPNYHMVDRSKIKSVFIQLPMRYEYLFPGLQLKTFYVQNAPVFAGRPAQEKPRRDYVWAGTMLRDRVEGCLEFFNQYPQYRLVLKGGANKRSMEFIRETYGHLITSGRITIDNTYLPEDQFTDYLSAFRIGFVFYSWHDIRNNFNFYSAPSGKLFMCLAAGTPVIACNIPGFAFVKEFGVGVLIDDYEPATIHAALEEIESDFENYSARCYKAAEHFSFDKAVQPYIQYLHSHS